MCPCSVLLGCFVEIGHMHNQYLEALPINETLLIGSETIVDDFMLIRVQVVYRLSCEQS